MKTSFFKRLRNFFRTTALGGLVAILPFVLIIIFFRWIINIIQKYLEPLVGLINTESELMIVALYIIAVLAIILLFFLMGLFIRTSVGRFFRTVLEEQYLSKIPGYKLARETVMQFFGKQKSFFREVVLVDIFNSGTLMTGFITDDHDDSDFLTVFVPTGPNPTSGNIYHVLKEKTVRTRSSVDVGMKTIISCGAGSCNLFKERTEKRDLEDEMRNV
ncbi:MAG: DUF502 domain-containing protein [Bacteroidales bacterium]|nr:DUF502 domain-containing protein [Bacteroidales bacterium]